MSDFLNKNKGLLIGSAVVFAALYFFGVFESCQSSDEVAAVESPTDPVVNTAPAITTMEAAEAAQPQKVQPVVVTDEVIVPVPNANIQPESAVGTSVSPEASASMVEDVVTPPVKADQPASKADLNNQ